MGHVVNYAYRLHETKEWVERFGPMNKPYEEEYRPAPVQPRVRAPPARLVRAEAPRRGLGRDVRRLDDAGARLAHAVREVAGGAPEARVLRPRHEGGARARARDDRRGARRGRRRTSACRSTSSTARRWAPRARGPQGLEQMLSAIFADTDPDGRAAGGVGSHPSRSSAICRGACSSGRGTCRSARGGCSTRSPSAPT